MPIQSRNCEWESGDVNCMYILCFDVFKSTGNMLYFAVKKKKERNKSISDIAVLFVENKTSAERRVESIVLSFLLCDIISCLLRPFPAADTLTPGYFTKDGEMKGRRGEQHHITK